MEEECLDQSSIDVWKTTMIERYEDHAPELEAVTLAEFATDYNMYTWQKGFQRVILRYRGYSIDDPVNFKREHVLHFLLFHKEVDVLDQNCFERVYEENSDVFREHTAHYQTDVNIEELYEVCNSLIRPYEEKRVTASEISDVRVHPAAMEKADSDLIDVGAVESNAPFKQCPAVCTRQDVMSRDQYLDTMRKTNEEQYEIVREVVHRLTTPDSPPLQIFFTGVAECGETFVLRLIIDVYNPAGSYNLTANVACAATGKAAVALSGVTVHAAFKLSLKTDGGLRDELNTVSYAFRSVRCVIIEEVSKMFADILQRIDSRLRSITCKYL
ncbi:hypothetical protein V5799_014726 [Amblyomma americanum]|uniref:ATP-dependent DNA helicase n=1 Tax=Amblyomma americanum TaxID=6943 RepID=A0AAQ4E269_AMBAM